MRRLLVASVALACVTSCSNGGGGDDPFFQPRFDVGTTSASISNRFFRLKPGVTNGALIPANPDAGILADTVVVSQVSHFPVTISGNIETTEMITRSFQRGELIEQRVEFFAEDDEGNVWILGAEVTQFDDGDEDGNEGTWVYEFDEERQDLPVLGEGLVIAGSHRNGQRYLRRLGLETRRMRVKATNASVRTQAGRFEQCLELLEIGNLTEPPLTYYFADRNRNVLVRDPDDVARFDLLSTADDRFPTILPDDFQVGVDHPYFPLNPGTTFVFAGATEEGRTIDIETQAQFTRRSILGVDCTVVLTTEFFDGLLISETEEYYGQDLDGTVWRFGRTVTRFDEEGMETGDDSGSWIAGTKSAQAGVVLPSMPMVGDSYRRGFRRATEERVVRIDATNAVATTPLQTFFNAIQTRERDPLEPPVEDPDGILSPSDPPDRLVFYASGFGPVLFQPDVEEPMEIALVDVR